MDRIDEALRVHVFQRAADAVADRFDRSCYWLAGQAAIAIVPAFCLRIVCVSAIIMTVCAPLMLFAAHAYHGRAAALEKRWRARPDLAPLPPHPTDRLMRAAWLAFLTFDGVMSLAERDRGAVTCAADIALLAYFYFLACVPRLPRAKRAPSGPLAEASAC